MVAVMVAVVVFVAVNAGIFVVPDAANPIEGVEFAQANPEPGTLPFNKVKGTITPLQYDWLAGTGLTDGVG